MLGSFFKKNLLISRSCIYFESQSTFIMEKQSGLDAIKDIKQMMERSSRFISLSGLSGVAAGICALVGAWFAYDVVGQNMHMRYGFEAKGLNLKHFMGYRLFTIALYTLVAAIVAAFLFTWWNSKKTKVPLWGSASKRLFINFSVPLFAGGVFLLKMIDLEYFGLIAPGCLIFYGIALVNASKYTLGEIRYLGYGEIILGLLNCWMPGTGLLFWTLGFGVLHIIYGVVMWWKYEKTASS